MRKCFFFLLLFAVSACSNSVYYPIGPLPATYVATEFLVQPNGGEEIDVLSLGGELKITVDPSGLTTGSLSVPPGILDVQIREKMDGYATLRIARVEFFQEADTFVRELIWVFTGTGLTVVRQVSGDNTYTITLARITTGPYRDSQRGYSGF
ncbi:MAG: hypothetical protein LBG44_10890 [Gemmatimonadota bacterium]|jgi:hypothetical protein|nr:hypothetical protein [Gemmatimonadota bacterium]